MATVILYGETVSFALLKAGQKPFYVTSLHPKVGRAKLLLNALIFSKKVLLFCSYNLFISGSGSVACGSCTVPLLQHGDGSSFVNLNA